MNNIKRILVSLMILALSFPAQADQRLVLRSLETLKANTEVGVNAIKYNELIADAEVEINILKRESGDNKEFASKAEECLTAYKAAGAYIKMKRDFIRSRSYAMATQCDTGMQNKWQEASALLESLYDVLSKGK